MIVEKDIDKLAVGSYVVKILEKTGNYKLKRSGLVRDQAAIDHLLNKGVLRVAVDTNRSLSSDAVAETKPKTTSVAANIKQAKALFEEAKDVQTRVFSDIKQGRPIKAKSVVDMTNKCIDSIFTNPDALACVINIRHKDQYLLEHSISVSILATIFGRFLKFDRQDISKLAIGAFLHDVGKIMVPDEILNKPGKLTDDEFEIIKSHVVHSASIVNDTLGLSEISRSVVANHHEKLNGSGYPAGKTADQLDIYDRIITICDIFDAVTATRVYKKGMGQTKAFTILRELAGRDQLDAKLVDQFIRCLGIYPVGSVVRLSTDRLAMVEKVNKDNPLKPLVKEFYSLKSKSFVEAREIDLASDERRKIEQGVRADDFDLDMNKVTEFLMGSG